MLPFTCCGCILQFDYCPHVCVHVHCAQPALSLSFNRDPQVYLICMFKVEMFLYVCVCVCSALACCLFYCCLWLLKYTQIHMYTTQAAAGNHSTSLSSYWTPGLQNRTKSSCYFNVNINTMLKSIAISIYCLQIILLVIVAHCCSCYSIPDTRSHTLVGLRVFSTCSLVRSFVARIHRWSFASCSWFYRLIWLIFWCCGMKKNNKSWMNIYYKFKKF